MSQEIHFNFKSQAHLFVGQNDIAINYTINFLQKLFCKKNQCGACTTCNQIKTRAHEQVLWLAPEKQYNLEQIDTVLKNISFTLEEEKQFFIIFLQADLLTTSCSNRLLKSIEEPPSGYYFLLLTNQPRTILPTIYSRCVVTALDKIQSDENQLNDILQNSQIGKFFLSPNLDPIEFLKAVDKSNINEYETVDLVNSLINLYSIKCKKKLIENDQKKYDYYFNLISVLNNSLKTPPMPGSSKVFWKNLFISFMPSYLTK